MSKELEYKEKEAKIINEESRKYDSAVKIFDSKSKVLTEGRDEALKCNQELQEEILKLRKSFTDKEIDYENKINALVMEKTTLTKNNSGLSSENKKILAEIAIRESLINKTKQDLQDANKSNDRLSGSLNDKLEEAKTNYYNERKLWEREKHDLKNVNEEYIKQCESLKLKIAKMENDEIRNNESVKKSFFKMIDDSLKDKYKV